MVCAEIVTESGSPAGCLVLGGVGLAASVVAFAAWARKQIVRWGS
jgi:hypothetical protein